MKLKLPTSQIIRNQTVMLRVDFNVPLKRQGQGVRVTDTTRLKRSFETINFLRDHGSKILLVTHLGRPNGKYSKKLSTKPVAKALAKLLDQPVLHCPALKIEAIDQFIKNQSDNAIIMLENIRFWRGEKSNDLKQAQAFANLADVYINDGFAVAHRSQMSVVGIPRYLPSFAGFGFDQEVQTLYQMITKPKRPFVAIVGGAKICDKVTAVEHLAKIANVVLVGGGVANNFLAAAGYDVAASYLDEKVCPTNQTNGSYVHFAQNLITQTRTERMMKDDYIPLPKIIYPSDVVAATNLNSRHTRLVDLYGKDGNNGNGHHSQKTMFLDIGPKTIKLFKEVILSAGTVFWNGPMGVFEQEQFSEGTREIAKAVAKTSATTVLGGGDTIAAINRFGLQDRFDYVSAAGGAALEFLAGKILPGMKPLLYDQK